jgi:O-antigen/teichoic acid export membrane protein
MALAFFFYRVFISLLQPMLTNIFFKILINFSMLLLAMLMFVSEIFRNSYMAVVLFMLPWCFAFFIMLILLVKKVKLFSVKSERIDYKNWLDSGLSGLPYTLVLFTIPYLAIIGAEVFLENEDSVGIFATAASFSQLVANNFIACIQSLTLAPIALAIYQDSMQEVRSIFKKNLMVMGAISVILILITYVFGKDILLIYGQKYVVGHNILLIFMVTQSVVLTGCLAAPTLLYMGKNRIVATSSISLVFLIVVTVSVFGYIFQELGIAFAMLLSIVIVFVTQSLYAYKLTFERS